MSPLFKINLLFIYNIYTHRHTYVCIHTCTYANVIVHIYLFIHTHIYKDIYVCVSLLLQFLWGPDLDTVRSGRAQGPSWLSAKWGAVPRDCGDELSLTPPSCFSCPALARENQDLIVDKMSVI